MSGHASRRDFLKTGALAGASYWVASRSYGDESTSAMAKVNFACIGVGGKGTSDTEDAAKLGNVVAICDIDDNTLEKSGTAYPDAQRFHDFREMFAKMGDKIDAVTISTPDHTHAVAAAMAMRMGKHAFVQKPLTHSLYEARKLTEIARDMKVATQMGNQGTAEAGLRRSAAMIRAGMLGTVKEVHIWSNRPIWPQGTSRPPGAIPPKHVHWDLWLGPAAFRRYTEMYHPFKWRGWWDFGTGALGDMACHMMNMPFMALDLRDPIAVEAETSGHNKESFPSWSKIRYEFPSTETRPELTLFWYDGGKRPNRELLDGENRGESGILVIGDKGKLFSPGDYAATARLMGGASETKVDFPQSPGHFAEFVRAIHGGEPAMSNIPNYSGGLTETVLLGNLAVWKGGRIEWDAVNLKAVNAPDVDSVIQREYRDGYTI